MTTDPLAEADEETKERTINNAKELLLFLVTNEQNKIRLAEMRRAKIRAAYSRGEKPQDHRVQFIHNKSHEIFGWLGEAAQEFNKQYPFDMFTTGDIHDLLLNALGVLKEQLKKSAIEDEEPKTTAS